MRALADALGLDAKELEDLLAAVGGRGSEPRGSTNAMLEPVLGDARPPLIGRDEALAEVRNALLGRDQRIVTITGPGGVGKTSLALEVARTASDQFADGVVVVPLESLDDPSLVLSWIAGKLGLSGQTRETVPSALHGYFRDRRVLLVLDNFEHLLNAAPEVAQLVTMNGGLTVLVTSRAPLRIRSEREYPLEPLTVPDMTRIPSPEEVGTSDAVQLFMERARASSRAFDLTQANAPAIAAICRRLDGLPLALELAAARLRVLSPTEILGRLDQSLPLLTGGARDLPERQRTMQQVIAWSYRLLAPHDQALFRRLSVFSGGFDTEVAMAISEHDPTTLDILSALVEHSLLIADTLADGSTRYRMLETIRQFGNVELAATNETEAARDAHLAWFVMLSERANAHMQGSEQSQWLEHLEREHGNVRSALSWSQESPDTGRREEGLRMAGALWSFWYLHGHMVEGEAWLRRTLAAAGSTPSATRARAHFGLGMFTTALGDLDAAIAMHEAGLDIATQVGSLEIEAMAHFGIADALRMRVDVDQAIPHFQRALHLFQKLGASGWAGITQISWAGLALRAGEIEQAEVLAEDALRLVLASGDVRHAAEAATIFGRVACIKGDFSRAASQLRSALVSSWDLGDHYATLSIIAYVGGVAADTGRFEMATRLAAAAAAAHHDLLQHRVDAFLSRLDQHILQNARNHLGGEVYERIYRSGYQLTLDDAVIEAVDLADEIAAA
jgi:predicted ATPase